MKYKKNYHHFNYEKSIEITVPDIWFHSIREIEEYSKFNPDGTYKLLNNTDCRTQRKDCIMLFTNPINREVLINIFENNIEFWIKTKNLIKESERLRLFLPKINNPVNFLQFIRELGGELYGFPPGRTLAINDIVNFAFLFPVILNAPHVLEGGCNEIKRYMLDNKLPIPSTWDKPKTLPKKYQLLWDKNIINVDTNKILGFNLNQIDFKKNKFFPLKIKK